MLLLLPHSVQANRYRAVVGEYNLDKYEGNEQFIRVERIIIHPGWNGDLAKGWSYKLHSVSKRHIYIYNGVRNGQDTNSHDESPVSHILIFIFSLETTLRS